MFLQIFYCNFNLLVRWFRHHRYASGVRLSFRAHPKMGAATFNYLPIVLACNQSRHYLITSSSHLTFKPEASPYFRLVSVGGLIRFSLFHTCVEHLGPPGFLVIFNYHIPLPVTGWPTTSYLAWLTQVSCPFVFFPSLILSPEILFITWIYHITLHPTPPHEEEVTLGRFLAEFNKF